MFSHSLFGLMRREYDYFYQGFLNSYLGACKKFEDARTEESRSEMTSAKYAFDYIRRIGRLSYNDQNHKEEKQ